MSLSNAQNIDARNGIVNNVSGNQYMKGRRETREDVLKKLGPATMDPSKRTGCLENTRVDIIKSIIDWVFDPTSTQNVLWLNGLAGSGKSTISTTISNHFRELGQLGSFLFFDRDVTERSDPALVIRTLAYQLGLFQPKIGELIAASIESTPTILLSPLPFQFQRLLIAPLSNNMPSQPHIVLVLDALDECGSAEDREVLVNILANRFCDLPSTFRTIVVSRAEIDIRYAFESQSHILALVLDLTTAIASHDISSYFRYHMTRIRNQRGYLGVDWPGEDNILGLTARACGLFVWASTAIKFINGQDPRRRLDMVLRRSTSSGAESALDSLYKTALNSAGNWDDEDFVADFKAIIGMVLTLRNPLSTAAIDSLMGTNDHRRCAYTVSQLGCIVSRSPQIRIIHPSFGDFLMTRSRCGRDIWFFQTTSCHHTLTVQCLDRLTSALKRNVCNLTLSMGLEHESLPEDVAYACLFWIDHICMIREGIPQIVAHLHSFLYQHLLHWFEAMSILKKSRDTISLLDRLLAWITVNYPNPSALAELARDSIRFAQTFGDSIAEHPLLVYHAALPYTPITSPIYQRFHDIDLFSSISGGFLPSWSSLLLVLGNHKVRVNAVAVSSSSTGMVSGTFKNVIQVWDSYSGAEALPELRGHEDIVLSVSFSYDGTRMVSCSKDKTIRIWDMQSGTAVFPPLTGHESSVQSVAFSSDGTRIVSGSQDMTVRVWNAQSGIEARLSPLRGHKDLVSSVAFSPSGNHIVSGSHDRTIRVWDARLGVELFQPLQGHKDWVRSVAFSPDGTRIVSGSHDWTIRVWNTMSGTEILSPLQGHKDWINSVGFSPDGTRIVSGSCDNTMRIWDATSGAEILASPRRHASWVQSVAFSPDGTRMVSGSADGTVRVWDTASGTDVSAWPGHEDSVRAVAFSNDGSRIASGSYDFTIRLWDTVSGAEVPPRLRGHHGYVFAVAFSSDGVRLVSGSNDSTIRVWSTTSGAEVLQPLRGHSSGVRSVAFSPNGAWIVSGAEMSIRVWNAITGEGVLTVMHEHETTVYSIGFSPDGTRIVSASHESVRIWDAFSGVQTLQTLELWGNWVRSVAFSSEGTRIIASSLDSAQVWDATSGSLLSFDTVSGPAFSPIFQVTSDRWIVDATTNRTISKLPASIVCRSLAMHGRTLCIGTDGRVIIMTFPSAVMTSPETRHVQGKGRLLTIHK